MQETGKQRKPRIPLDYFKRPDRLARGKLRVTIAAVALTIVWWASGWLRGGDIGRLRYSRGPVADAHATWDASCSACHVPATPIDRQHWLARYFRDESASESRCRACHAGPKHHDAENPQHTPSCASCHPEHRGREASLVRVPDQACTQCHSNLHEHKYAPLHFTNAVKITGFVNGHPPFRVPHENPGQDPGRLKFSHVAHMTPGMLSDHGVPAQMRVAKLDAGSRSRFGLKSASQDSLVQLQCDSCHRLDDGDPVSSVIDPTPTIHRSERGSGDYFVPIKYENQCRPCHALTVAENAPNWDTLDVPHGIEPPGVRKFLEQEYAAQFLRKNPLLLEQPLPPRPMPGLAAGDPHKTAREQLAQQIALVETKFLYAGSKLCAECHYFTQQVKISPPEQILKPSVPEVWFRSARFDHSSHRALDCTLCHAAANEKHDRQLQDNPSSDSGLLGMQSDQVMLPGIETCRQCHAPRSGSGATARGGARFDCTECHRYHNGDFPQQGIGANARDARDTAREFSQFLNGSLSH